MLIPSPRHRPEDLELWREYEASDRLVRMRQMAIDNSLAAIRAFAHLPCYCGTSWGKDSVAVCHLLWKVARHVPLMHLRPTNHNPDCDAVRDAYFATFPGQSYTEVSVDYSGLDRKSLPMHELDERTDERWYSAIRQYQRESGNSRYILGIRAAESNVRAFRVRGCGLNSGVSSAPIGHWSTQDVFSYLVRNNLPVHPVYAMLGGGRWDRGRLRVAEIGDTHGCGGGRREWEQEYYGDVLRRLQT